MHKKNKKDINSMILMDTVGIVFLCMTAPFLLIGSLFTLYHWMPQMGIFYWLAVSSLIVVAQTIVVIALFFRKKEL